MSDGIGWVFAHPVVKNVGIALLALLVAAVVIGPEAWLAAIFLLPIAVWTGFTADDEDERETLPW